jgi:O-methyltransferase
MTLDQLLVRVRHRTVVDPERLYSLAARVKSIHHLPGDVVECGVAGGGSAAVLAWTSKRHCWLYDSCRGLPAPTSEDVSTNGDEAWDHVGDNKTTPGKIADTMYLAGVPASQYTIKPGWFQDTFFEPGPSAIALLHIDADWYESVYACLTRWYDAVVPHGIVVLDDYGYWEGCRKAYELFCDVYGVHPKLHRVGGTQAWWEKP